MNLETAKRYADKIVEWLAPQCDRIEISGSIRRERPNCNDVDLVCIPKVQTERDLIGAVASEKNLLWEFLTGYVNEGRAQIRAGGNVPGKFIILQLKSCQLDVYFATPETLISRLICRTGSKEHNIWIAERANIRGTPWKTYDGLERDGKIIPCATEEEFYEALGLEWIRPQDREGEWLRKHLEAGL